MKIANIDRETSHNFWTIRKIAIKFFRKSVTFDNI